MVSFSCVYLGRMRMGYVGTQMGLHGSSTYPKEY